MVVKFSSGLKKLNPALESTFDHNIRLFQQTAKVVKQFVNEKRKDIVAGESSSFKINIKKLFAITIYSNIHKRA